ncbi:hypothetical protein B296_00044318 [Ensete ventricosum]|uniref:Uncharacterized protein n=1 Tax=Ensete ventricosum TaxID=4639 RepID=A0A426X5E0_ENSVE|nr:hypothetical protein B296_00044318 [Ensete ventricosum]
MRQGNQFGVSECEGGARDTKEAIRSLRDLHSPSVTAATLKTMTGAAMAT